ncbi:transposase [Xanthobacter sp. DSM 24535]|uniref:transposase n=1 Tax=Roseixanthobacter psychrophilus TaxID=3119917 RepID=UPI003729D009
MTAQRMEIITGVGRRRTWPMALREQIVSETLASETTVTEVARRHDVDRSQVYRWRRDIEGLSALTAARILVNVVGTIVRQP